MKDKIVPVEEYVDVRGVHPTYVRGLKAVSLPGKKRDISLADAGEVARAITE